MALARRVPRPGENWMDKLWRLRSIALIILVPVSVQTFFCLKSTPGLGEILSLTKDQTLNTQASRAPHADPALRGSCGLHAAGPADKSLSRVGRPSKVRGGD